MKVTLISLDGNKFDGVYDGGEFGKFERAVVERNPILVEFDTMGEKTVIVDYTKRRRQIRGIDGVVKYATLEVKGRIVGSGK